MRTTSATLRPSKKTYLAHEARVSQSKAIRGKGFDFLLRKIVRKGGKYMTTDERLSELEKGFAVYRIETRDLLHAIRDDLHYLYEAMAVKRRKYTKIEIAQMQGYSSTQILRDEPWRYPPKPDAGQSYSVDCYRAWIARPEAERREIWTNAGVAAKHAWIGLRGEL
jgi:hypothetical protein